MYQQVDFDIEVKEEINENYILNLIIITDVIAMNGKTDKRRGCRNFWWYIS